MRSTECHSMVDNARCRVDILACSLLLRRSQAMSRVRHVPVSRSRQRTGLGRTYRAMHARTALSLSLSLSLLLFSFLFFTLGDRWTMELRPSSPTVHQDRLFQSCFPIFSTVWNSPP